MGTLALWNYTCKYLEIKNRKLIYGKVIEVDSKKMVVDICGNEKSQTIVLLPGLAAVSPILEFKPLVKKLSENYRVITIEPFGYGLSDSTNRKRSIENITDEIHECLQKLGVNHYYLMGHSLSGIYSLYYSNMYEAEVDGFIGIDSSVPKHILFKIGGMSAMTVNRLFGYIKKLFNNSGILRLMSIKEWQNAIYVDETYPYTSEEIEMLRSLTLDNEYNSTVLNEMDELESNYKKIEGMKFPKKIPVFYFISSESCKTMKKWEEWHVEVINGKDNSKVMNVIGGHYLHFEKLDFIVNQAEKWIKETSN